MAEDRKPKIDLKSRLQRMGGPGAPTPAPPMAAPMPTPAPAPYAARSAPPPAPSQGLPRPPLSAPAPALDPSNPLAALVKPSHVPTHAQNAAVGAQAQRIEVDEEAVHRARGGARKQGFVLGIVIAVGAAVVSYMGGTAHSAGAARSQGINDAHELAGDLLKAKASLDAMKTKVSDGGNSLVNARKFPTDLSQSLAGMNIDFGGDKLFGRRFSGVPAETTRQLFDFIVRVQALNDKKDLVVALLTKLQKPISQELARGPGQLPLSMIVVVDKDTSGGNGARIAPLVTPIAPDDKAGVPNELLFGNPMGSGNVKLPRLVSDKIPAAGAAIPVVPTSYEKVCPSKEKGQIAQLMSSMNSLVDDIQGQQGSSDGIVQDNKPGLAETAQRLADQLSKVN
jgi:hypothetical protein